MELTRDLAKMTPEIRRSSEILFARNVARYFYPELLLAYIGFIFS